MTPEQERIDQIKQWWQEFRWTILGGLAVGIAGNWRLDRLG